MGGCVSAPKEVALNEGEAAPVQTPITTNNVEGATVVPQENSLEEGEKKEEPLVDTSEAKEEAKAEEAEVVEAETKEPETEEAMAEQPKAEEKSDAPLVAL